MSQPFMQLYVADYLGDTRHLTTEQHGAYLLLLMTMWRAEGRLPNCNKKLARIVGATASRWAKIKAEVLEFFEVDGESITSPAFARWQRAHNRIFGRRPLSASTRAAVMERDGYRCAYCLDELGPFEVDHVFPVSRGGTDDDSNLVCACRQCNRSKAALTLDEWGGRA